MRYFLACFIVVLSFIFAVTPSVASSDPQFSKLSDGEIGEALDKTVPIRFLPGSLFYFFISTKESISRFFQPSAKERAQFDFALSGKRLKETYMLAEKNDYDRANRNLLAYTKRNGKIIEQINKARAQNQAVEPIVASMADLLIFHERLLLALDEISQTSSSGHKLDDNFLHAVSSFTELVMQLDNILPGIKNRFEIIKTDEVINIIETDNKPTPTPLEATPSYRPRRIIY